MFNKNTKNIFISALIVLAFIWNWVYADDIDEVRTRLNSINSPISDLPSVPSWADQKWFITTIIQNIFDSTGQIKVVFIDAFNSIIWNADIDDRLLYWDDSNQTLEESNLIHDGNTTTVEGNLNIEGDIFQGGDILNIGDDIVNLDGKFIDGSDPSDAVYTIGNVGIGNDDPESKLHITNAGDGAELLRLEWDRIWTFRQTGVEAESNLDLHSHAGNKAFTISGGNDTLVAEFFAGLIPGYDKDSLISLAPEWGTVGIGADIRSELAEPIPTGVPIDSNHARRISVEPDTSLYVDGKTHIKNTAGDGAEFLKFEWDRGWSFRQKGSLGESGLDLYSFAWHKSFTISSHENEVVADFFTGWGTWIPLDTIVSLVPEWGVVGIGIDARRSAEIDKSITPHASLYVDGQTHITNTEPGAELLRLEWERTWTFSNGQLDILQNLDLRSHAWSKSFTISAHDGTLVADFFTGRGLDDPADSSSRVDGLVSLVPEWGTVAIGVNARRPYTGLSIAPDESLYVDGAVRITGEIHAPIWKIRDIGGGWVRTYGDTGWYSGTHGGGWHMTGWTYIDAYSVDGVRAESFVYSSDKRLKTNIQALQNSKDILNIQAKTFDWKEITQRPNNTNDIWVIAQELEQYFPQFVNSDDQWNKTVNYPKLVVPLIDVVRDQQDEIETLKADILEIKALLK